MIFNHTNEVENRFVEDFMSDAPNNKKCSEFTDYLTLTYITQESLFPPQLGTEKPSDMKRTNNGPESFHCHYNEQFYASYPSIYQFVEVLIGQQTFTYIKMGNMSESAPIPQSEEKTEYIKMAYEKYTTEEYAQEHVVRSAGFRYIIFHPLNKLVR